LGSGNGNEVFQMEGALTKLVEEWGARFNRMETALESVSTATESLSTATTAQNKFMGEMRHQIELILRTIAGGNKATALDFDRLLSSRLQPLTLALDSIQHQHESAMQAVGNGKTTVVKEREEITFTRTGSSFGEEGRALPPEPRSKQIARPRLFHADIDEYNPEIESFKTATESFFFELKSHEEGRRSAFLADVKKQQNEVFQASLAELKRHQDAFMDRLESKSLQDAFMDRLESSHQAPPAVPQEYPITKSFPAPVVSPSEVEPVFVLPKLRDSNPNKKPPSRLMSSELLAESQSDDHFTTAKSGVGKDFNITLKPDESLGAVFLHDGQIASKPYYVEDYYKTTGCSQALARSHYFQGITLVVVFLNAVWIGYDADKGEPNLYDNPVLHQMISQFFNAYFFLEWLVRFLAFRRCRDAANDGWLKFDTFLVVTMLLDSWVLMVILHLVSEDGGSEKHKVTIPTQPFRVLRILKLTRMAKLINNLPELVVMIKGLFRSCRAIVATIILVLLMNYVWAIILHMILKNHDDLNQRLNRQSLMDFTSVGSSMWILLMDGTLMLDNAAPLMTELIYDPNFAVFLSGILFIFYSLISALLLLQILIGVLCDVVSRVNHEQRDAEAIALVKQELRAKLLEFDTDKDGHLSRDELHRILNDPKSSAVLRKLSINRGFLYQLQESVFARTDQMDITTALEMILLCRSDNAATVESLAGGFCFLGTELHNLHKSLSEQLSSIG